MTARSAYRRFWAGVGERFPDLGGAASTRYYADNEQRLFTEHFAAARRACGSSRPICGTKPRTRASWRGRADRGARAYGVDISEPTVMQARAAFTTATASLRAAVGDVRALPFGDDSFDAIYSMGTIEHFDETEQAVAEMARVLKPGGRAIVGVPNRHDPFLRPLLATAAAGGRPLRATATRSPTRAGRCGQMLERAGLRVGRRDRHPLHPRMAAGCSTSRATRGAGRLRP